MFINATEQYLKSWVLLPACIQGRDVGGTIPSLFPDREPDRGSGNPDIGEEEQSGLVDP
jgi:hypothetical protein